MIRNNPEYIIAENLASQLPGQLPYNNQFDVNNENINYVLHYFFVQFLATIHRYQNDPLSVDVGKCVNFTARSYYSVIERPTPTVRITWKKDTHVISNKRAWYAILFFKCYYDLVVTPRFPRRESVTYA